MYNLSNHLCTIYNTLHMYNPPCTDLSFLCTIYNLFFTNYSPLQCEYRTIYTSLLVQLKPHYIQFKSLHVQLKPLYIQFKSLHVQFKPLWVQFKPLRVQFKPVYIQFRSLCVRWSTPVMYKPAIWLVHIVDYLLRKWSVKWTDCSCYYLQGH